MVLTTRCRTRPCDGLSLLGDKLSAEQAMAWGMIWQVVEDDALRSEASKLAEHLASQPTYGLSLIKKAIKCIRGQQPRRSANLRAGLAATCWPLSRL